MADRQIFSSFRDPSGILFVRNGLLLRQINNAYKEDYTLLMRSGLYKALVNDGFLIHHEEINAEPVFPQISYKVIKPEIIPFISYPYEWCFSQLKDAALLTLKIQKKAFEFGMSLKDCSAYNVQFRGYKPVFIDTLSFEKYKEGKPWVAYRQFCQHFLAPLALASYKDIRLSKFLRVYIDGVPLDLASKILPFRTRINLSLSSHIHLHSRSQSYFADKTVNTKGLKMSRLSFFGLIDSLESLITRLKWQPKGTEWADYYEDTNYSEISFQHKKDIVSRFLKKVSAKTVWDIGANVGIFSRIASSLGAYTISLDSDPVAIEKNYLKCVQDNENSILPLVLDLTNPSPNIGWHNQERTSFLERGPVDVVLALALVHHLSISNNLPFNKIADFLAKICNFLVIEFVPKSDSQVQRLLTVREDIFPNYIESIFEQEFSKLFVIQDSVAIEGSGRKLYLMRKIKA